MADKPLASSASRKSSNFSLRIIASIFFILFPS
jgi:hypothetical protein